MNDEAFEKQLRREFLEEATELLERAEQLFVELEKTAEASRIIDGIFRIVHTIKGSSAAVGFGELSTFAHAVEATLSRLRDGALAVQASVIDGLLAGVDGLKVYVRLLQADEGAHFDSGAIVQRLQDLRGAASTPRGREAAGPGGPVGTVWSEARSAFGVNEEALVARRRILVVDDDAEIVRIIADVLSELQCEIITAPGGREAIEAWEQGGGAFCLLVCDQNMPHVRGTGVIRHVRASNIRIPVLMVSGATNRDEALEYINLGVHAFFDKPFDGERLLATAKSAILSYERQMIFGELSRVAIRSYMTARRVVSLLAERRIDDATVAGFSRFVLHLGLLVKKLKATDF